MIRSLFTRVRRRGILGSPDTRSCIALAWWTGVQTLPPARLFSSWVLQDHRGTRWSKPRLEDGQYEGRQSLVRFLEHPPIRRGSGGPQKPFSSLSEGLRGVFTICTEAGERPHVPAFLSSGHDPCVLAVGGAGRCRSDLSLVTFVVTLGRR